MPRPKGSPKPPGSGRRKGSPWSRNPFTAQYNFDKVAAAHADRLAKDVLRKNMTEMLAMAEFYRKEGDEDQWRRYKALSRGYAQDLLNTETPHLGIVTVAGDKNNPLMVSEGTTPARIREILLQKIMETGIIPTALRQLTSDGVADGDIIDAEIVPERGQNDDTQ